MESEDDILAALLEEDCTPPFEEELVDGVMRSLERDVIGVDSDSTLVLPPGCSSCCYLHSDSAHSLTCSTSLLSHSTEEDHYNGIGLGEGEQNELGYLMEASDEELGLSPQLSSHQDLGSEDSLMELLDFEPLDFLSGEIEWVPHP